MSTPWGWISVRRQTLKVTSFMLDGILDDYVIFGGSFQASPVRIGEAG